MIAAYNTLSDDDHDYVCDARGRMAAVATDEDERHGHDLHGFWPFWNNHKKEKDATQFNINGLGERLVKSDHDDTTVYAYDEAGHIIGEYDGRGNALEETVYLGDLPIAVLGGGSDHDFGPHYQRPFGLNTQDIHYITPDNLGAPHTITDSRGRKVWQWHHTPFGDSEPDEDGFSYNLRFPGQIHDPESGLNYNMARDYNPATGRYIQNDPIGLLGGSNPYVYVRNNPLSYLDRRGLCLEDACVGELTTVAWLVQTLEGEGAISGIVDLFSSDAVATYGDRVLIQTLAYYDQASSYLYTGYAYGYNLVNQYPWLAVITGGTWAAITPQQSGLQNPIVYGGQSPAAWSEYGSTVIDFLSALNEYRSNQVEQSSTNYAAGGICPISPLRQ
jgi:RHS repeat-associated protein